MNNFRVKWRRPADNSHVMIDLTTHDGRNVLFAIVQSPEDQGIVHHNIMQPDEARKLAKYLNDAADRADEGPQENRVF